MTANEVEDPAVVAMRDRLMLDLRQAMKAREASVVSAIRSFLARLDNASAIEQTCEHVSVFGRSADVPRRLLTHSEARVLLTDEISLREIAIPIYEKHNQDGDATRLREEVGVLRRYLS